MSRAPSLRSLSSAIGRVAWKRPPAPTQAALNFSKQRLTNIACATDRTEFRSRLLRGLQSKKKDSWYDGAVQSGLQGRDRAIYPSTILLYGPSTTIVYSIGTGPLTSSGSPQVHPSLISAGCAAARAPPGPDSRPISADLLFSCYGRQEYLPSPTYDEPLNSALRQATAECLTSFRPGLGFSPIIGGTYNRRMSIVPRLQILL